MPLRQTLDQLLTILGVIAVVVPVTLLSESWTPPFISMLGILLVGAGTWRLGTRLLPNRRIYLGLRSEVEHFIRLVRRLNTHALQEDLGAVAELRIDMKESVDRMVAFAGKTEAIL
jgi:hypothetical protein